MECRTHKSLTKHSLNYHIHSYPCTNKWYITLTKMSKVTFLVYFEFENLFWVLCKHSFVFLFPSLQREFNVRTGPVRAQTTATTTPSVTRSAPEGKKTLRKGSVIVTGASSGLGLATAKALAETGKWHVIMACRDFLKAERAAKSAGIAKENYTIMHLDLASLDSVRQFVDNFRRSGRPLDVLVCNAAVYQPTAKEPSFTAEGFELSVGTNHLGHFLLSRLLLDDLNKSDYPSKRLIIVGSITGRLWLRQISVSFLWLMVANIQYNKSIMIEETHLEQRVLMFNWLNDFREHKHFGWKRTSKGQFRWLEGTCWRIKWAKLLVHDWRWELWWRKGLQGQQSLQHADHARIPQALPRGNRDHIRFPVSWLHCHNWLVQRAHSLVPASLPSIPKVHHQGLCIRRGRWQKTRSGKTSWQYFKNENEKIWTNSPCLLTLVSDVTNLFKFESGFLPIHCFLVLRKSVLMKWLVFDSGCERPKLDKIRSLLELEQGFSFLWEPIVSGS